MTTLSPSKACSRTEELAEHRRLCRIAAEYTKQHPRVTIACAMCPDGTGFLGVAVGGEAKPRVYFDAHRGVSREELFARFGDAAGIEPDPPPDDDWDW